MKEILKLISTEIGLIFRRDTICLDEVNIVDESTFEIIEKDFDFTIRLNR